MLTQSERHGLRSDHRADHRDYPHTRINIGLDEGLQRAIEGDAFMQGVPYARYE